MADQRSGAISTRSTQLTLRHNPSHSTASNLKQFIANQQATSDASEKDRATDRLKNLEHRLTQRFTATSSEAVGVETITLDVSLSIRRDSSQQTSSSELSTKDRLRPRPLPLQVQQDLFLELVRCVYLPLQDTTYQVPFLEEELASLRSLFPDIKGEHINLNKTAREIAPLFAEEVRSSFRLLSQHSRLAHDNVFVSDAECDRWLQQEKKRMQSLLRLLDNLPNDSYLMVQVHSARELDEKHSTFVRVELELGDEEESTEKTSGEMGRCKWSQSLELHPLSLSQTLVVRCVSVGRRNTTLGIVKIPLSSLADCFPVKERWYSLQNRVGSKKKKPARGALQLSVHLVYRPSGANLSEKQVQPNLALSTGPSSTSHSSTSSSSSIPPLASSFSPSSSSSSSSSSTSAAIAGSSSLGSEASAWGVSRKKQMQQENISGAEWASSNLELEPYLSVRELQFAAVLQLIVYRHRGLVQDPPKQLLWLLDQFCFRHGISSFRMALEYVDLLHIGTDRVYNSLDSHLRLVQQYLKRATTACSDTVLTCAEKKRFDDISKSFQTRLTLWLEKYRIVFPREPWHPGAVNALLHVLSLLMGKDEASKFIQASLRKSASFYYELYKQNDGQDTKFSDGSFAAVLANAADFVKEHLLVSINTYAEEFFPFADLVEVTSRAFLHLIRADVNALFRLEEVAMSTQMMDLYPSLARLNAVFIRALRDAHGWKPLSLRKYFEPLLPQWLHQIKTKQLELMRKHFEQDVNTTWPLAAPDASEPPLHSQSVVDLFYDAHIALSLLAKFKFDVSSTYYDFMVSVCDKLESYADLIVKSCASDLAAADSDSGGIDLLDRKKSRKAVQYTATRCLCVRVNNFVSLLDQMTVFADEVNRRTNNPAIEEKLIQLVAERKELVNRRYYHVVLDMVAARLDTRINSCLDDLLRSPPPAGGSEEDEEAILLQVLDLSAPLFEYINQELSVLSEHLYENVLVGLIARVWQLLLQDVDSYIFPEEIVDSRVERRPRQATVMRILLRKRLIPFFHADGLGAPKKALRASLNPLLDSLQLFDETTADLVRLYRKLCDEQASQPMDHSSQYADLYTQPRHVLCVLAVRTKDSAASELVTSQMGSIGMRNVRRLFALLPNDEIFGNFKCRMGMFKGSLIVTTHLLCFEPSVWTRHRRKISWKEMLHVSTPKSTHLVIRLISDEVLFFRNLKASDAQECFRLVLTRNQAAKSLFSMDEAFPKLLDSGSGFNSVSSSSGEVSRTDPSSRSDASLVSDSDLKIYQKFEKRFAKDFPDLVAQDHILVQHHQCYLKELSTMQGTLFLCNRSLAWSKNWSGIRNKVFVLRINDVKQVSTKSGSSSSFVLVDHNKKTWTFAKVERVQDALYFLEQLVQRSNSAPL